MNSQILTKINYFIKNRLIELLGFALVFVSIFLLASIVSYSPSDPNFIYSPENTEIKNIGGFYGSVISDFLLQSLGLISIFLVFNFFCWGLIIIIKKKISNFVTKIFFTFVYMILGATVLNTFFNDSFWLIDNGNGGFVGREIKENIYYFTPLIENQYVIYSLSLLTIVFFILSLSMKPNEITIILLLPFAIIKKMASLFNKNKKKEIPMPDEAKVTIFVTSGPETPQRCATPFYMANIAAAMDNEAEMIFQIDGVLLMKKDVADGLFAKEGGKSIMDFIRDAKEADVEMRVCSAALQLHDMTEDDLIEECDGVVGAAYMTDVGLDSELVLTY